MLLALLRDDPDRAATLVQATVARMADDELVMYTARTYALGLRAHAARACRARALRDSRKADQAEQAGAVLLARLEGLLAPEHWIESPPPEAAAYGALAAAELERLRGGSDPARWDAVAELWTQLDYRLELAYARLRQAEGALAAGAGKPSAKAALHEAAEIAGSAGAPWLTSQIEGLARSARIDLAPHTTRVPTPPEPELGPLGLTHRELEVLALLADGRTNPQIAKALFISPKTASTHVSHILAKLSVGSRVEAATAAYRLGLISQGGRTSARSPSEPTQ